MSEKILVPILGESITEATIVKWLKKKGESVEIDEPIVELETDKVNLEVPAPADGILSEINANDGQVVEVGTVLGLITNGKVETSKKEVLNEEQKVEIKTGMRTSGNVEIISGLQENDKIVAEGLAKTRPGAKIKPIISKN